MAKSRGLLERLLNTPDLPAIVPRLEPELLHRVIQAFGLEDCVDVVALATPEQVARVVDSDVWRARAAGSDEEFDAGRFGMWLEVLMQSGAAVAAEKLAGLDIDLVIAGLAHHVAVFDFAAASSYTTLDGEQTPGRDTHDGLVRELGGYLIESGRTSVWDAILDLLAYLESDRPEYFHRVMRGCVRLSSGPREEDGFHALLDDRAQELLDRAGDREAGREQRGYIAPAQARAFLHDSRAIRFDADRAPQSAIARAYFRAMQPADVSASETHVESDVAVDESNTQTMTNDGEGVAAIVEILEEAGLLSTQPRALLGAADQPSTGLAFIHAHAASHPACEEELAYLANALLAGGAVQRRAFTAREASDCAVAVCNLGLEYWPAHWPERDLIAAFQVGWTILHRDVGMYAAQRLIDVLADIRCGDRDTQLRLDGLRRGLIRFAANGEPWHIGDALDALLVLDATSWAGLRALIDECPVLHAAVSATRDARRTINPHEFAFISHTDQIASIREFLEALPSMLSA
jgi:hypothetical protein